MARASGKITPGTRDVDEAGVAVVGPDHALPRRGIEAHGQVAVEPAV